MSGATSAPQKTPAFVGELTAGQAWLRLAEEPAGILVDVRSEAEWNFVGHPNLESISRPLILIEWQSFPPGSGPNPDFVSQLKDELEGAGYVSGTPIFFLCRSGARSRKAAHAAAAAGIGPCFNVSDGFEGNLDAERHRGGSDGWKAAGLPWVQS